MAWTLRVFLTFLDAQWLLPAAPNPRPVNFYLVSLLSNSHLITPFSTQFTSCPELLWRGARSECHFWACCCCCSLSVYVSLFSQSSPRDSVLTCHTILSVPTNRWNDLRKFWEASSSLSLPVKSQHVDFLGRTSPHQHLRTEVTVSFFKHWQQLETNHCCKAHPQDHRNDFALVIVFNLVFPGSSCHRSFLSMSVFYQTPLYQLDYEAALLIINDSLPCDILPFLETLKWGMPESIENDLVWTLKPPALTCQPSFLRDSYSWNTTYPFPTPATKPSF